MNFISNLARIAIVVGVWACIWRLVVPKTQLLRVLRAALLVLSLSAGLVVMQLLGI